MKGFPKNKVFTISGYIDRQIDLSLDIYKIMQK